jgi:hypothetical protein
MASSNSNPASSVAVLAIPAAPAGVVDIATAMEPPQKVCAQPKFVSLYLQNYCMLKTEEK